MISRFLHHIVSGTNGPAAIRPAQPCSLSSPRPSALVMLVHVCSCVACGCSRHANTNQILPLAARGTWTHIQERRMETPVFHATCTQLGNPDAKTRLAACRAGSISSDTVPNSITFPSSPPRFPSSLACKQSSGHAQQLTTRAYIGIQRNAKENRNETKGKPIW